MFNSFSFSQGQSSKRIGFTYSGEAIYYRVNNNLFSTNRRSRTEFSTLGYAVAGDDVDLRPTTTGYTGAIVFDRDNMMQDIFWTTTGATDSLIGTFDLSSQSQLRGSVQIAGHHNLTKIIFPSDVNPVDKSNSAITTFSVFANDLRNLDISGFHNIGEDSDNSFVRVRTNFNLTAVTWPSTIYRVSLSIRDTMLTNENLSPFSALTALDAYPLSTLSAITFPTNIISAATGVWQFQSTKLTDLDMSVMGPNFGGSINLFGNTSLTAVTFPSCSNSVSTVFMQSNGYNATDTVDLSPMSGIAGSITIRNQSNGSVLFGPSSRSIVLMSLNSNSNLQDLDFSMLSNVNTDFRINNNSVLSGMTLGGWSNSISLFQVFSNPLLATLDISNVTGLRGLIRLHSNASLTATTLPTIANTVTNLELYNCPEHGYLDMKPISGSSSNDITLQFDDNSNWDETVSNHILHDLDNFGWTGGSLSMSGTTSGYDTSSGGINGFSHYQSLTGKSWTIIMSGLTS